MNENSSQELDNWKVLAGIKPNKSTMLPAGSNISMTGSEKRRIEREKNIKPGTDEWFRLWFSRPYLTGETPVKK